MIFCFKKIRDTGTHSGLWRPNMERRPRGPTAGPSSVIVVVVAAAATAVVAVVVVVVGRRSSAVVVAAVGESRR